MQGTVSSSPDDRIVGRADASTGRMTVGKEGCRRGDDCTGAWPYSARTLSRRAKMAPGSVMVLPPAVATKVPLGRCAFVSRSFLARWTSLAAKVSLPVVARGQRTVCIVRA